MLNNLNLNRVLFLDIETVPQKECFSMLTEHQQEIFKKRFKKDISAEVEKKIFASNIIEKLKKEFCDVNSEGIKEKGTKKKQNILTSEELMLKIESEVTEEIYSIKASLFVEWNRVLVISVGVLWKNEADDFYSIKIISFADEDEKKLLSDFINHPKLGAILNKVAGKYDKNKDDLWSLCAYNGEVFDFQIIAKRLLINGFKIPAMFDYSHLKPWEVFHLIDPKKLWSYGIWDSSTSLESLCDIFNIPSSKDDINGSQVAGVFYKDKDLPRIVKYCEKDVISLSMVVLKIIGVADEIKIYNPGVVSNKGTTE